MIKTMLYCCGPKLMCFFIVTQNIMTIRCCLFVGIINWFRKLFLAYTCYSNAFQSLSVIMIVYF